MKASNFFKAGIFAAAFSLFAASAWAQNYTPFTATGGERIDTVTVGSRMPYKMDGDPIIANIATLSSEFKWTFYAGQLSTVSGSPLAWEIKKETTTGNATQGANPTAYPNYYTDKEINVTMPASITDGKYSLVINQRTIITATGTAGCEGEDSIAWIQVVPKPTALWTAEREKTACVGDVLTDVTIPMALTGYGQWVATYDIIYTSFGATPTTNTTSALTANLGVTGSKAGAYNISIPAATFTQQGKYEIRITNVTDRISRKSLDVINATVGTDVPAATEMYTVYVYPKPTTKKLQHVRNIP